MSNMIFTQGECKKKDLFDILIAAFQAGGWTVLNPGGTDYVDLYSDGTDGNKKMWFRFYPYDGTLSNASYDIRTTNYTDCLFRFGSGYSGGNMTFIGSRNEIWSFMSGRNISPTTNYSRGFNKEWDMRYWYYCDKDRMIWVTQPFEYTGYKDYAVINFLGVPEELYLQEYTDPFFSGVVFATSSCSYDPNRMRIAERPASIIKENNGSSYVDTLSMIPTKSPNADGIFQLNEVYFSRNDEGLRGKLGGFYMIPTNNILDGDIIQVQVGSEVHQYRYILLGNAWSGYTSLPTRGLLIRIS
jgi:hypothetical protein